jgi:hypothetical protein
VSNPVCNMTANETGLVAQHYGGVRRISECRKVSHQANQCWSVLRVLIRSSLIKLIHSRVDGQSLSTLCDGPMWLFQVA